MRPLAYVDHIRCIESCQGLAPEVRQVLLDSARRQLFQALQPQEQRVVFAYQLLEQGHPRDTIPGRICTAFGVQRSQAYRDLTAAYALFPRNGNG